MSRTLPHSLFFRALAVATATAALSPLAHSRIGEAKNAIESRLNSKVNGAYQYSAIEDKMREVMELPYKKMFVIFPSDVQTSFYFKRAEATQSVNADTIQQHDLFGWELNLITQDNKSVLEFYRRHGDPMTVEELKGLMNSIASMRDGAYWKKNEYVPVSQQWEIGVKNGKIVQMLRDKDGKLTPAGELKDLDEILPMSNTRFIYIDVPPAVQSLVNYNQSIPFKYMEQEQRAAYEKYRNYVEKQSAYSAAKTAAPSKRNSAKKGDQKITVKRVNPADAYTFRGIESTFCDIESSLKDGNKLSIIKYSLPDVLFGGKPIAKIEKEVRLTENIPQQPDTAFGYDYELSDGSVRAKLFRNAVLFFDAGFDRQMRNYMESLYKEQQAEREKEAKTSLNLF
ncbi:putative uncharacterized protein [Coraliomargarita sp. CAG:312]|nr:putative uncharacterized protein [Coraliomargarita sp. CAG:312]